MLHPSNSHSCSNHNFQTLMLSQHSDSLHNLMSLHKHLPSDNSHLLEHMLIHFLSIPFQLQRPLCLAHQNRGSQNQSMEKESRIAENKVLHPHLMQQMIDSAFDANSWVTSRKIVVSYPTAPNARLEATSQQSVLPSNRTTGSRTKGTTKDAKLAERIGRKHRTNLSS